MKRRRSVWFLVILLALGCLASSAACRKRPTEESKTESEPSVESELSEESEYSEEESVISEQEPESREESENSSEPEPVWDGEPFTVEGSAELGTYRMNGRELTLGLSWSGTAIRTEGYPDPVETSVSVLANGKSVWKGVLTVRYPGSEAGLPGALIADAKEARENGAAYLMLLLSGQEGERVLFLDGKGALTGEIRTPVSPLRSFTAAGHAIGNELTDEGARVLSYGPAGLAVLRAYPFDGNGRTVLVPVLFHPSEEVEVTGEGLTFPRDDFRAFKPESESGPESPRLVSGGGTSDTAPLQFETLSYCLENEAGYRISFRKAPVENGIRLQVLTNGTVRSEFTLEGQYGANENGRLDQLYTFTVRRDPAEGTEYMALYFLSDAGNLLCLFDFEGNWQYVFRSDVRGLGGFIRTDGMPGTLTDRVTAQEASLLLVNAEDGALIRLSVDVSAKGMPVLSVTELIPQEGYEPHEGSPTGEAFDPFQLVYVREAASAQLEVDGEPWECTVYPDGAAYLDGLSLGSLVPDGRDPILDFGPVGSGTVGLLLRDAYFGSRLFMIDPEGALVHTVRSDCGLGLRFYLRESGRELRDYLSDEGIFFYLLDRERGALIRFCAAADGSICPMEFYSYAQLVLEGEMADQPEELLRATAPLPEGSEPAWSDRIYVQDYLMNGESHRLDVRFAKTQSRTGTYLAVEFFRDLVKVGETVLTETRFDQPDRYYADRAMRALRIVTFGGRDYLALLREQGSSSTVTFLDGDWNAVSVFPLDFGPDALVLFNLGGEAIGDIVPEFSSEGTVIYRSFSNESRTVARLLVSPADGGNVLVIRPLNYLRGQLEYPY